MTILIVGIALPLMGWVAGSYIGILPSWYSTIVVPFAIALVAVVLAIVVWNWLDLMD